MKPLIEVPTAAVPPSIKEKIGKPGGNKPDLKAQKPPENDIKPGNEPGNGVKKQEPPKAPEPAAGEPPPVIPMPFRPVDQLTALASGNPALALVMLRQLHDMQGPMPDTSNGAVAMIDLMEQGIKRGEDVTVLSDQIASHIMNSAEHNELLVLLHDSVDRERANEILKSRAKLEDFWHGCMRRSDLNILEGMALTGYFNGQLSAIFGRMERKVAKGETASGRDPIDLVSKVNIPTQMRDKQIQRKFDEIPPQEREILRKLGFKVEQALAARITKTTTTETVEIVQQPDGTIPAN